MKQSLIERARHYAGLTQHAMASKAGTSRPTLSAYEHGHKSPSLETAERVINAAGYELDLRPHITWRKVEGARSQIHYVPNRLFRVDLSDALRRVAVPIHLDWSTRNRVVDPRDRRQRARWYEVLLREGSRRDLEQYLDGALLVDLWPDMVVPRVLVGPWQEAIERTLGTDEYRGSPACYIQGSALPSGHLPCAEHVPWGA